MRTLHSIDPQLAPARATPRLRLAVGRVLTRLFVGSFAVFEVVLILTSLSRLRGPRAIFRLQLLFGMSILGFLICALVSVGVVAITALVVRMVLRPWMAWWYDPRPADASIGGHAPFRLGSSEWIEAELPARRRVGRRTEAGHLILTNHCVWFFPSAWDSEPCSFHVDRLDHVRIVASWLAGIRAVRGWPDEVIFRDEAGDEARIAVADPVPILDWFEDSDVPRFLHQS